MTIESIIIRYQAGEATALFGETTPQEGDEMTRQGNTWTIEEVTPGDDGEVIVKARPG